jgi:peptidoglycan/xylan/chitin deacetylase (PgdA/CDA1 family)
MPYLSRRALLSRAGLLLGASLFGFPHPTRAQESSVVKLDCPILTYHEVWDRNRFARLVGGYLDRGYQPVSLQQLARLLDGEDVPLWGQPFLITFDDGLRSARDQALPFLVQRQIPAVFAVMPDWRGDRVHSYMANDDFKRIVHDYGMEVISHTFHHPNLVRERARNQGSWQAQVVDSRYRLEEIVGDDYQVEGFCFPFGAYDAPTLDLVAKHYRVALSTRPGTVQRSDERLALRRTSMS